MEFLDKKFEMFSQKFQALLSFYQDAFSNSIYIICFHKKHHFPGFRQLFSKNCLFFDFKA